MKKQDISENVKKKIRMRVIREFPRCKCLQDIHYYRYLKEIEWKTMSPAEIVKDIKQGADQVREKMKKLRQRRKFPAHESASSMVSK